MLKSMLGFTLNGYSEEGSEDEFGVELAAPKKQEVRRDFYETDYRDLKASLSSIYALPPKFPFSSQPSAKTQRFATDLLHSNKRSTSETKLIGLEDVRKLDIRFGRRYSCCCTACGGYRLSQKYLISQIPRSEGGSKPAKPKVTGLDGFMKNIQSFNTKSVLEHLPALIGIGKFKTLGPVRRQKLVASPPTTPRLHQLLDQIKAKEATDIMATKKRLSKRRLVWLRIQSTSQLSSHHTNSSIKSTQSCDFATASSTESEKGGGRVSAKLPEIVRKPAGKKTVKATKKPQAPKLRAFTQLIRRI